MRFYTREWNKRNGSKVRHKSQTAARAYAEKFRKLGLRLVVVIEESDSANLAPHFQ